MELKYTYNKFIIELTETPNEGDIELEVQIVEDAYWPAMKNVQRFFEENEVYTDVLFYPYENHRFHIIVREDHYATFILCLMKHKLLQKVEWI
ncbi:hypothetical protein [Paenibacillus sp. OV219]|uniref:hypothetical protein n=1 Tax=Paenibacillus sp. OV219 TaxID=1884377 RepID=UPI0008C8A5CF|nr:hypothetical protein [Paenibacillus sp. OV219]SEO53763.1 hypothetical protein SAMN05518847_108198 [Paenibacillus sp. OV219]